MKAIRTPLDSICGRCAETSAMVWRQNVQPKCRRKKTSVGERVTSSASGEPGGRLIASDTLRSMRPLRQLLTVVVELADALRELLDGHRVLVVHPAEVRLVERDLRLACGASAFERQCRCDLALGPLQRFENVGADGEQVATGQVQ